MGFLITIELHRGADRADLGVILSSGHLAHGGKEDRFLVADRDALAAEQLGDKTRAEGQLGYLNAQGRQGVAHGIGQCRSGCHDSTLAGSLHSQWVQR